MLKIVKIGGSYRVTIPKPIMDLVQWKVGDEVGLQLNKQGEIIIRKVSLGGKNGL